MRVFSSIACTFFLVCNSLVFSGSGEKKFAAISDALVYKADKSLHVKKHLTGIPSCLTNKFCFYYFHNLRNGLLSNDYGNCTYTALGTLISYYDNFLNDSVLPESYETGHAYVPGKNDMVSNLQSPGISNSNQGQYKTESVLWAESGRNDLNIQPTNDQVTTFERLCKSEMDKMYSNGWYLGYLYHEAFASGAIAYRSSSRPDYLGYGTTDNYAPSIFRTIFESSGMNAISDFKYKINGLTRNEDASTTNKADVRNFIINNLLCGVPVVCGGSYSYEEGQQTKTAGHTVTAYYYDQESDTIYGNLGYSVDSSDVNLDGYFNLGLSSAYAFVPKTPLSHSHSYNYVDDQGTLVCSCGLQSHQHHDCSYSSMNENNHVLHCSLCGDTIQSHMFSLETYHFGKRYRVCKYCGFCKLSSGFDTNPYI